MKNSLKKGVKNVVKMTAVSGVIFALFGCAQKPVLNQVDSDAPETAINTPAQAQALKKEHSK